MTDRLRGEVALVIGRSRGIGAIIARRLAAEGTFVGLTYRSRVAEAEALSAELRGIGSDVPAIVYPGPAASSMLPAARHERAEEVELRGIASLSTNGSPSPKVI